MEDGRPSSLVDEQSPRSLAGAAPQQPRTSLYATAHLIERTRGLQVYKRSERWNRRNSEDYLFWQP
jgi:hypothetical protein